MNGSAAAPSSLPDSTSHNRTLCRSAETKRLPSRENARDVTYSVVRQRRLPSRTTAPAGNGKPSASRGGLGASWAREREVNASQPAHSRQEKVLLLIGWSL